MTFDQLVDIAADLHCFSAGMVTAGEDIDVVRVQLSRWVSSGRLVRIHKGWYTLRDPFRRVRLDFNVVACTIKRGSYVSLQSALAYHGMIPEYVAETTCVTTGRPLSINSPVGRIRYRHVKRDVFFGYRQQVSGKQEAYVASAEKALLDLFYLTHGSDDAAYIAELRLQASEQLDTDKILRMAERFGATRLLRAVEHLIQHLNLVDRRNAK
jgi:predicted transcriptional regulator of viral defense system